MQPWEQNWSGQPASSEAAPWERQWGGAPVAKPEEDGDFIRGGKEAFQQLPQMGYGLIAGAGAIGEKVFGEGGIATGVKQAGLKGYTEWADKMAAQSKPSDSWSYSYDKAKDGDFGALVDWLQHGIGYAGAQGIQVLATAGIGAAGGKLLIGAAADKLASGMVAKEAARLAAENATVEATKRIAADQIRGVAVKNVASKLGQLGAVGALATGQEGGEIFGGLVQKAEEEGTQLSGGDLARAFGATLAAGGLEFVGDKLGLDVLLGRSKLVNPAKAMTGLGGRAARGVLAGAAVAPAEAATEYFQTGLEEYGKGTETNPLPWLQSPENQAQAFDAAALGGLGGAMVSGAGGAIHGAQTGKREEPVANIEDIATAPSIDEAIIAADKAVRGEPTRGERVANIKAELSDLAIVGDLRTKYGDDGFSQLLTSLNQANNPRTPEATREKHLQAVETALFNLRASVDQPAQTALLEGQQLPMLTGPDGLPLLGNVSTPTGTMRAGPDGVAVPETAADLTETMRARDERTSLGEQQGQMPDDVTPTGMRQEQPAWTNPRSKTPEPTIIDALNVPNAVNAYVDKQRAINTPMAHAFVQAFDSGRITPADVAKLIVPAQQETPNDRIAAAAATAPQTLQQRLEAFRRAPDATTIETPVVASRPRPKGAPDAIGGTGTVQDMAQGQPEQAGQPAAAPAPGSADALPVGVQSEPDAALSLRERADAMRAKNAPAVASAEQPAVAPEKPRVFKTRKNAIAERDRLGNEHKLQKIKGGYILRRKTDKEMAAEARAGRRFASGAASGLRRSLLATIAAGGGLNISERPDTIGEGNRNVGGRMVFTRAGKTINQWAETLAQSGFIPPGEVESDDGVRWLQDAISEEFAGRREHFAMDDEARMEEAARAAQGEEPAPDDALAPLSDFDLEELSADGYAGASPEVQALTEQALAAADEAGIDIEALREDAAHLTEGLSDDEYHAQLQASARAAIAQTRTDAARRDAGADQASKRDRGAAADTQGDEGTASEGLTLEAQDAKSLREKTEREAAAKAAEAKQKADDQRRLEREAIERETRDRARQDASAENFVLGQDANDALAGQGSIFDAPQSDAAARADSQPAPDGETAARKSDAAAPPKQVERDERDRSGLNATDRRRRDLDAAAAELAGQIANDMLDGQYATPAERSEIAPGLRHFAEQAGVPADDLRQEVLKRIRADERLTKRQTKQIVDAMDPTRQSKQETAAPAKPIADVGEKIGGSRKDKWAQRGLNAADLDEMSESEGAQLVTKANVWKPDYAGMVSDGATPQAAALVKVIFDSLAAKPRANTPQGRRDYVTAMQAVRSVYGAVKTEADATNAVHKLRDALGLNARLDGSPAAQQDARRVLFSVYKGRSDPFAIFYNEKRRASKLVEAGFPGVIEPWTRQFTVRGVGGDGITDAGVERYLRHAEELGTPLTAEQLRAGAWTVGDKAGGTVAYAATKADAEAMAKTLYEAKLAGGEKAKEPQRPHLDEIERDGLEQAIDRDVTAGDFINDFGFRGVEWGNWAAQDERQKIANLAYDALADLARILNVPHRALSLNGTMGMAFGARGGGRFAAHYESGKLVINMTKLRGAGSLAHEWAHAFDHYIGELGLENAYQGLPRGASGWDREAQYNGVPIRTRTKDAAGNWTNTEARRLANLRPELAERIDDVMRALFTGRHSKADMLAGLDERIARTERYAAGETDNANLRKMYESEVEKLRAARAKVAADPDDKTYPKGRSKFAAEAQRLSGKSSSGYWLRPTEMFARAFEAYVFDRLVAMGAKSDYLVHGVEADRYASGDYKGNPYPTGEERATINRAFDALVAELKTRETDNGVAVYSRASTDPDFKRAGAVVDGRAVRDHIPNRSSIEASMYDPRILPGVREVPMSAMDQGYIKDVQNGSLDARTQRLADEIKESDELNPLIVAIDENGPYILEGGHRYDALIKLGANSFPALVVIDESDAAQSRGARADWKSTPSHVRAAAMRELGEDTVSTLERAGLLTIAARPPGNMPSDVAGMTKKGRITLYADNIAPGSAAVAYHEALHATLRRMIGDAAFEALMRRMPLLAAGNRKWFAEAADRIPADTAKDARNSELASYAVEQYQLAREAMPAGVRKWVQDFIAAIKVGLGKALQAAGVGLKLRVRLLSDAAVLHKLARDGLRAMARDNLDSLSGQGVDRTVSPAFSSVRPEDAERRGANTRQEIRLAHAAHARIVANNGVASADDLRDMLRVPGYSQWAQSALVGNVDATRALRRDLDAVFEDRAARHDWTRPIVNAQGVVTFHDLGSDPQAALEALTSIADRYGAPIAARGPQMDADGALRAAGFVGYSGMQERAGRPRDALIHWIRPAGGIVENTPLFSVKPDSRTESSGAANALKALSENDELFALPKSRATTVEEIAADIDPQIKVTAHPAEGLDRYTLTMPDGKTAELFVRTPSEFGPHSYGTAREGEPAETVRPGEDQYNMRGLDDVWINVSRLEPGGGGARIYAIAGDFAHNTGRVFIGDPAGVSPIAKRRRSEAMLSSALRWGTTEHLAPHPMQVRGDKSIGVPPLRWVEGDDLGNIRNLIDVNLKALDNAFPSAKQIEFDVATGQFRNAVNGGPLDRLALRERVRAMRSSGASGASMGEAGGNTIARGAVWRALLREAGGTGETGGRRDGLLARLARLGSDAPQAVSKLFARGEGKSTAQALRAALESEFGADTISALERAGLLTIADKPAANMPQDAAGVTENGRIGLFADNTAPGSTAVAYHEALHATLRASIGDAAYDALMARMPTLASGNKEFFAEANKRIPANTPASVRAEEQASYAVEAYQKNREAMPAGVRKFVQDLIAAFKAGLAKALQAAGVGLKLRVTLLSDAAVLHKMARDGLRAMARERGASRDLAPAFSRGKIAPMPDDKSAPGDNAGSSGADGARLSLSASDASSEEQARADGYTIKAYRGVSKASPFNDTGSTWLTTNREVAEAYAEEVMGYDDPDVLTVMVKPDGLTRHDASRLDEAQREALGADSFGNPQALGIYDRSDDHPLGGSRSNVTVIHAPREAVRVIESHDEPQLSRTDKLAFSRAPATDTAAFKKWFGASVVTENGKAGGVPLVVYHGTTADFSEFRTHNRGALTGADLPGSYFAAQPHYAASAGATNGDRVSVGAFYLALRNPALPDHESDARYLADDQQAKPERGKTHRGRDGKLYLVQSRDGAEVRRRLEANGFDGVVREMPHEYIAFRPEQIKSANGNSGAFDATNPDIRYSIAGNQARASWDAPEESRFDSMVYKLQDKQIDTKRVVEAIRKASASLADQANVYLQEELFHGRAAKRTQDFVDLELRPAIVQMQMRGLKVEQLDEYLHARHAEEANELIADRNPDIQDAGSGMSTADARAYLAGLDQTQKRHLEAVAAKIDDIIKGTRDLYAAYGLESADTLNGWAKMFKHYVPLMREDHDGGMGIGQGFSIKGRETKSRTGSANAKVIDILANVALQRERVIVRGEKNRVSNALVGLAEANPNPDFWSVGTPPPVKVYNEKTNQVEDRVDPLFKSRDNVIVAKVLTPSGEVVEKAVMFNESNDRALRMSKSLKNMDTPQLEGLLGNSAKITRYFSAINTQYNPVFGVVNLVRDFQGAILNLSSTPLAGHSKTIAGHTLSALRGVYLDARAARDGKNPSSAWAALWDEFQNEGGQTGYRDLFRTSTDRADAIKRELDPTKWMESGLGKFFTAGGALKVPFAVAQKGATGIFGWLSDYNLAMENAVRLAAYKTGLEQGLSKQHAASIGKNLTVNFNRKGQVGQQAGALYAFFNASMQGSARIAQTLFTMEGSDPSTIRLSKAGKKIVYGGILLGTVQALALAAAGFDDEEPPEFVRERSLIIPTGGKNYITIPMPLGLHILPNLGRIPTEFVLGGFKKPVDHIVKMLALFIDAFNPVGGGASLVQTISPTAIDPIVALAENRDWTGKPIARTAYNPATPGHKLTRDTASAPAKFLSEAINFLSGGTDYVKGVFSPTPDQIDFLWGQVTGGVGRELNKADQTVTSLISGESLPPYKVPLIGRFYGNSDSQSSQANSFYSSLNQINEHEAEVKGLRKDGKGLEAARYIRENPESMLISAANAAERRVRELRTMKRDMIARNAPSTQIVAIEHQISARMQAFNELVKRLREKKAA